MKNLTEKSEYGRGYAIDSENILNVITKLGKIEHQTYELFSGVCDERCKYRDLFEGMEGGQEKLDEKCDVCPLNKLANLIWEEENA